MKLFDIAANMTDQRFFGKYYGKQAHANDWEEVIQRARGYGVRKFLFASISLKDAQESLKLAALSRDFYSTIGIHPTRASHPYMDFCSDKKKRESLTDEEKDAAVKQYYQKMRQILLDPNHKSKLVAIGECGLDYERLRAASKED